MKNLRQIAAEFEGRGRIQKRKNPIQNGKTRGNETVKTSLTEPNEYERMPAKRPVL